MTRHMLRARLADFLEELADRLRPPMPDLTPEEFTDLLRQHNEILSQVMEWSTPDAEAAWSVARAHPQPRERQ